MSNRMTQGTVSHFNARRGTGFVRPAHGEDRFPFIQPPNSAVPLAPGDPVEFTVTGGKAGIAARQVRRVRDGS